MAKRPNLSAFTTGGAVQDAQPVKTNKPATVKPKPKAKNGRTTQTLAKGSDDVAVISTTIRLPEDAWKQAKILAVETGLPLTRIFQLALDDYFEANDLPRLATR